MSTYKQALQQLTRDLDGVLWWLSDGAALGAVRDGRIIGGDVDLGVWAGDLPAVRRALAGRLRVDRPSQLKTSIGRIPVDIHGHHRSGDQVWFPLRKRQRPVYTFPAELFDTFDRVELYGVTVLVPAPVEKYLEAHYGPGWRTPTDRWHHWQDPPCVRWQAPSAGGVV